MSDVEQRALAECLALERVEKELSELGTLRPFPEDGMERYDFLIERISSLREKISKLKHLSDSDSELVLKLRRDKNLQLSAHTDDILQIEKKFASISEHEARLFFLKNEILKKQSDLMEDIRQLAPNWIDKTNRERAESILASVITSPAVLHESELLCAELDKLTSEIKELDLNIKNEKIKRQNFEEELAAMKRKESISSADIDALQNDIIGIREGFLRGEEINAELQVLKFSRKDIMQKFEEPDESTTLPELSKMFWLGIISSAAGLALCYFAGAVHFWWFAVAESAFIITMFLIYRKAYLLENNRLDLMYEQIDKRGRFFDSLESRITRLEVQRQENEKNLEECAKRLKLSRLGINGSIEALSEQLETARIKLDSYSETSQHENRVIMLINDVRTRQDVYERNKMRVTYNIDSMMKSWETWLEKMGFPTTIHPNNFEGFIISVNAAKNKLEALNSLRREAQSERNFISGIKQAAKNLCVKLNINEKDLPSVFLALKELPVLKKRISEINDNIARIASERKSCDEMIAEYISQIQELFAEAGAETDNRFRELAAIWERHWILEANKAERWKNLSILLGGRKAAEKYVADRANEKTDGKETN